MQAPLDSINSEHWKRSGTAASRNAARANLLSHSNLGLELSTSDLNRVLRSGWTLAHSVAKPCSKLKVIDVWFQRLDLLDLCSACEDGLRNFESRAGSLGD
jgi:hypothetical protein